MGGSPDICSLLLDKYGFDVDLADKPGDTPLALASGSGAVPAMDVLIAHGADPASDKRSDGIRPLHRAATAATPEAISRLAAAGVAMDPASSMGTPLCLAAHTRRPQNVSALLKHGADPNCGNVEGAPSLLLAVAGGSVPCIKLLVDAGADVSAAAASGTTPLHVAAALTDELAAVAIARLLLQTGADADARDSQGVTPLLVAAARDNRPLVELLLPAATQMDGVEWTVEGIIRHAADKGLKSANLQGEGEEGGRKARKSEQPGEAVVVVDPPEAPDAEAADRTKAEGDVAFRAGDAAAALAAYTASLCHDTHNARVWANRSAALLQLKRPEEALADAQKARALDPAYAKAWYREGAAYEMMKQWENAALAYFEASQRSPGNKELEEAFARAIAAGRAEHQSKQAAPAAGSGDGA